MTSSAFHELFGGPPRQPESRLRQRDMDFARSVQDVTEEVMMRMARHARRETGLTKLCLAGGVALNCVANGKILDEGVFDDIWIQPAAGDAGGALGAALFVWHQLHDHPREAHGARDTQHGSYLGPAFADGAVGTFVESKLAADGDKIAAERLPDAEIPRRIADLIADQHVIGWFHGRMEFGPRALGARSILGDARSPQMQETMNLKTKFRESFRPFAPTVLAERVADWFALDRPSPYMLLVAPVRPGIRREMTAEESARFGLEKLNVVRSAIPAVTHVDYSARVQTVSREDNPLYYQAIEAFEKKTGCPVIINTSFNVRGEPIVCTPEDAYRCFMRTNIDYLLLGNWLLEKKVQLPLDKDPEWLKEFELD